MKGAGSDGILAVKLAEGEQNNGILGIHVAHGLAHSVDNDWIWQALFDESSKKINYFYGYRTTMSMKNKDTWEFAHKFCGRLWFKWGLVLLPASVIPLIFVLHRSIDTIGIVGGIICFIQLVPLVASIFPKEAALKKTFDTNGHYR